MKFILLPIAILFTAICFAQGVPETPKFLKKSFQTIPKRMVEFKDGNAWKNFKESQLSLSPITPLAKNLSSLPNGNVVFALPQDNMPCIVPNDYASVPMPNVSGMPTLPYRYKGPGAIPNPANPIQITPKKK